MAVLFGQPFVLVYKGKIYGRPDMVAFAKEHPEVVARLQEGATALRRALGDRLTGVTGTEVRPLGPPQASR